MDTRKGKPTMTPKPPTALVLAAAILPLAGCGGVLLNLSDLLGRVSDGLGLVGTCLSDLDPVSLDPAFGMAQPAKWNGGAADLTDAAQPDLAHFYLLAVGDDVLPRWYLNERLYDLGPLAAGDTLRIELLSEAVDGLWLYDDAHTLTGAYARDYQAQRTELTVRLPADTTALFVRFNLAYLRDEGDPMVRVSRAADPEPPPSPQIVVLNFAGAEQVAFRSGWVRPTSVAPVDDPLVRQHALQAFIDSFADYSLTVLTDADPTPENPYSLIHIGYADPPLGDSTNGISEYVDWGNRVADDLAVVDLNSEALRTAALFGRPTLAAAAGKIAAHETGHLLGLQHVWDADDLMTIGCKGIGLDVNRILNRQFAKSPLVDFSSGRERTFGNQDAPAYLRRILSLTQP